MATQRTSNKDARKLVDGLTEFKGSNTFAEIDAPHDRRPTWLYKVYSYGYHFPMYIAEWTSDTDIKWYENVDRESQSTTRQMALLRPRSDTTKLDTGDMRILARYGIVGIVVRPDLNSSTRLTEEEINQAIHNISNSKQAYRLQAW